MLTQHSAMDTVVVDRSAEEPLITVQRTTTISPRHFLMLDRLDEAIMRVRKYGSACLSCSRSIALLRWLVGPALSAWSVSRVSTTLPLTRKLEVL